MMSLSPIRAFKYQPSRRFLPGMYSRVSNILPLSPGAGLARCVWTARSPNLRSNSVSSSITPTSNPNLEAITWSHFPSPPRKRSPWHLSHRNQRRRWLSRWSQRKMSPLYPLNQTRRNPQRRRKLPQPRQRLVLSNWFHWDGIMDVFVPRTGQKVFFMLLSAGLCEPYTRWSELWD